MISEMGAFDKTDFRIIPKLRLLRPILPNKVNMPGIYFRYSASPNITTADPHKV